MPSEGFSFSLSSFKEVELKHKRITQLSTIINLALLVNEKRVSKVASRNSKMYLSRIKS